MGTQIEVPVLIARKRDGGSLSADEVAGLVAAYLAGDASDAQLAAWMMAGVCNGFDDTEAAALTDAYLRSGDTVDLSDLTGPTVDKHSTGGVGDTTTLVVAPLLAAAGCQVAKLSGRGLGHTGGTLDKLEAVPGYEVDFDPAALRAQVEDVGVAVAAATADLVPADKRIYALRDVTGTVPSEALIAASVMSKKLAGGAGHIVLDVKVGAGAFMPTEQAAVALARRCVAIGTEHGRSTSALVTRMDQPLGPAIGNALEVAAAVRVLQGDRDHRTERLREVSLALAAEGLALTGVEPDEARAQVTRLLEDGAALDRFARWIEAQGGDPQVAEDPGSVLPRAPVVRPWVAPAGRLRRLDARRLGELAGRLGAGRSRAGEDVDHRVGLVVHAAVGDEVGGDPTIDVHAADEAAADAVVAELPGLVEVTDDAVVAPAVVVERVEP